MERFIKISNFWGYLSGVLLITTGLALSIDVSAKQQGLFLDANGEPIPNEILLQLSTGTNKAEIPIKNRDENEINPKKVVLNNKNNKRQSDPVLEEELFHALQAGQTQRVNQLLKMGTAATYKNQKGETPLGIAVSRGWASMIIQLIKNGANVKEEGARGVTLLHAASARGLTDVAKLLIKYGLNPSQRTDKNWTPLHVAARYGHWQLVQYYLSIGVDPNIRNSDGKTALGLAQHLQHHGIVKILSPVTTSTSLDFSSLKNATNKQRKKRRKSRRK
jgi:ankyrin repeat protein